MCSAADGEDVLRRVMVAVERLGELPSAHLMAEECTPMDEAAVAKGASDETKHGGTLRSRYKLLGTFASASCSGQATHMLSLELAGEG